MNDHRNSSLTMLGLAMVRRDEQAIELLVRNGATDYDGHWLALDWAAIRGDTVLIKLLIWSGLSLFTSGPYPKLLLCYRLIPANILATILSCYEFTNTELVDIMLQIFRQYNACSEHTDPDGLALILACGIRDDSLSWLQYARTSSLRCSLMKVAHTGARFVATSMFLRAQSYLHTVRKSLFRDRIVEICIALQSLELPALVTLMIVDELLPLAHIIQMHLKWHPIVTVKHFKERQLLDELK